MYRASSAWNVRWMRVCVALTERMAYEKIASEDTRPNPSAGNLRKVEGASSVLHLAPHSSAARAATSQYAS